MKWAKAVRPRGRSWTRQDGIEPRVQGDLRECAAQISPGPVFVAWLEQHVERSARALVGLSARIQGQKALFDRRQEALGLSSAHMRNRGPLVPRRIFALEFDLGPRFEIDSIEGDRNARYQVHIGAVVIEVAD